MAVSCDLYLLCLVGSGGQLVSSGLDNEVFYLPCAGQRAKGQWDPGTIPRIRRKRRYFINARRHLAQCYTYRSPRVLYPDIGTDVAGPPKVAALPRGSTHPQTDRQA